MLLATGAFAGGNDTLSTSSGCAIRKFWNISTGGVKDTLFVAPGGRFSIGFTHQVQYNTSQCQSSAGNAASYIVAINGGTGTNYSYAYLLLSDVVTPGARRGPTDFMLNIVAPTTAGYYYLNPATVLMPLTQSTVGQHATATQPAYEANTITILAVGTPSNGNNTPPPTSGKTYTYAVNSCITQTVNNVMLNGMRDTLFTTPGANLSVAFDWSVQYANSNCMSTSSVITYANGLEHYTGSCIQQG
ncbi:MAG TPA: hypothetical protein VHS96_13510, partial [Bacteroidia bacterium]|nr:hypothetical protein [Bacteroidia bacterium]